MMSSMNNRSMACCLMLCLWSSFHSAEAFSPVTPESRHVVTSSSSSLTASSSMKSQLFASTTMDMDDLADSSSSSTSKSKSTKKTVVDWDWKSMAEQVFETDTRPVVLFDGVCNMCHGGVNFAIDQDEKARFRFCSLHSKVAQSLLLRAGKSADDTNEIVLVTKDTAYFSSNAVSRICMGLDAEPLQWFGQLGQVTPAWIREGLFQFVSKNRHMLGESDSCRIDFDGTYTSRFVSEPTLQDDESS